MAGFPLFHYKKHKGGGGNFSFHKYGAVGKIGGVVLKNKKGGYHLFSY